MDRLDPISIVIGIVTIVVICLTLFFGTNTKEKPQNKNTNAQISAEYTDTVKLELEDEELFLDKNTFIEQKDIIINNSGEGKLVLFEIKTSCDCFSASFVSSDDGESPEEASLSNLKQVSVAAKSSTILRLSFTRSNYNQILARDQFVSFKSNDTNKKEVRIPIYSLK